MRSTRFAQRSKRECLPGEEALLLTYRRGLTRWRKYLPTILVEAQESCSEHYSNRSARSPVTVGSIRPECPTALSIQTTATDSARVPGNSGIYWLKAFWTRSKYRRLRCGMRPLSQNWY